MNEQTSSVLRDLESALEKSYDVVHDQSAKALQDYFRSPDDQQKELCSDVWDDVFGAIVGTLDALERLRIFMKGETYVDQK